MLNIGQDANTTAGQAQMPPLIERWKGENVNAVFITGLGAVSKVFVQAIKAAMPDVLIMTNTDSSAKGAAQDAVRAGRQAEPVRRHPVAHRLERRAAVRDARPCRRA